jgi:uncharacterized phage-associated protein
MLNLNPIFVANNILNRSFRDNDFITPMKLQKILYFLYRDYLKEAKVPLFAERFMAWAYGPVLGSVYDTFRKYTKNNISKYGSYNGKMYIITEGTVGQFGYILDEIWKKCKPITAVQLSRLTHDAQGAWSRAYKNHKLFLNDEDIEKDNVEITK